MDKVWMFVLQPNGGCLQESATISFVSMKNCRKITFEANSMREINSEKTGYPQTRPHKCSRVQSCSHEIRAKKKKRNQLKMLATNDKSSAGLVQMMQQVGKKLESLNVKIKELKNNVDPSKTNDGTICFIA